VVDQAGITYAHAPASALSRVMALHLHFDDLRGDNSPLRVLSGKNANALSVLSGAEIARLVEEGQALECLVRAGGIVAIQPLIECFLRNRLPRRVRHIEYTDSFAIEDDLRIATA
jgi:hypothetical protein